jgi:small ligand-binding sensory domain FIST
MTAMTDHTFFRAADASGPDWRSACSAVLGKMGPAQGDENFGFIYVTEAFAADLEPILAELKASTGIADWVGGAGMGVAATGGEYFDEGALAVMTGRLPHGGYCLLPSITRPDEELPDGPRGWLAETGAGLALIHADCVNANLPALIGQVADSTAAYLVGGLTMSQAPHHHVAGDVTGGGVSGVMFAPEIAVATGLTQGCTPVGDIHTVSDCVDNVLVGLDGENALDVFKRDIGEVLARDPRRVGGYIHAAFPVAGSDTGDYVVRNLVGIDEERGWLAIAAPVSAGDRVMFVRRDPASAREDLETMLANLKKRTGGMARGGVYVSCIARGPNMFGRQGAEIEIVREALGDIPVIGFFANGEISHDRLYSYTGVLTLFL